MLADRIWAIGGAVIAIGLASALFKQHLDLKQAEADRDAYKARIYAEETGFIAKLGVCRADRGELARQIERQGAEIRKLEQDQRARVEVVREALSQAETAAAEYRRQAVRYRDMTPKGDTECDRIRDLDAALVDELSK